LKQSFCDVLHNQGREFYNTGIQPNVGKSVLKMMETLWENSLTKAKSVRIISINVIVIAITFSEKKY
jgi:hypothetical protein